MTANNEPAIGWSEIYHFLHQHAEILRKQKAASDVTRQDAPEVAQLPTLENADTSILLALSVDSETEVAK